MKYWIITDSVQKGPLSIEELSAMPEITMSTPVWHEGLPDWTTAAGIPEIAAMIAARQTRQYGQQPYGAQPVNPARPYGANPYQQTTQNPYSGGAYGQGRQTYGANPYGQQPYGQQSYGQPYDGADPNRMPPMPDNYLVWAIIATICCCIPTGIPAIIYASKVSPAYMRGDYNAALDASSKAQLWVIISFVAGLIWAPFSMLIGLL